MDGENYWIEDSKDESPFSLKKKRNVKIKKLEFVGWGSAQLIEFLVSIGTDMSKTYSQHDVAAIVTNYVNSNNLLNPQKKKRVMCDDRLHALFGKKSIPRIKIHDLLEVHFKENHDESDDETSEGSDEDKTLTASKRRKTEITKVSSKKKVPVVSKSCLAAVIAENIKLVYLKRSLIMDLLKSPESSDDKILGCFVRVKSDPNDCFQKNSHQLQQVEGVRKEPATSSAAFEILLRLSNTMKDIPISSLSDDVFSEEELDNLRERINDGLLKKPTVLELELKAQVVHKDITKHWIERELALLQNRIDHANEKGWRKQLFEYMEKRKLLQTQKEQDRLLSTLPTVVAEELETEVKTVDAREVNEEEVAEERRSGDSPKSNFNGGTDKSGAGDTMLSSNRVLANGGTCNADQKEKPIDMIMEQTNTAISVKTVSSRELDVFANGDTFNADQKELIDMIMKQNDDTYDESNQEFEDVASREGIFTQETRAQVTQIELVVLSDDDDDDDPVIDVQKNDKQATRVNSDPVIDVQKNDKQVTRVSADPVIEVQKNEKQATRGKADPVIMIQKDEKQGSRVNADDAIWHYVDPQGYVQGPFSATMLKYWSECFYFGSDFRVWKTGQEMEDSLLLTDVFHQFFSVQ